MNNIGIYQIFGASGFNDAEREQHDYYATDPRAVEKLLEVEQFSQGICEPCCGEGHISKVLIDHGFTVHSSDLIDRGFGFGGVDFLTDITEVKNMDIRTNPPYKYATEFVRHALDVIDDGRKVAMLMKIQFLEGIDRYKLFQEHPPKTVYVFSKRIKCFKNGIKDVGAGTMCFAWYVWEKGFNGDTIIKWLI